MKTIRAGWTMLLFVTFIGVRPAFAQRPDGAFELGAQTTLLRLSDLGQTNAGIGGRASFDLSRWASLEAEINVTPHDNAAYTAVSPSDAVVRTIYHRRRADALFGTKLGLRGERFGAFARVRPGIVRLTDKGLACVGQPCAFSSFVRPVYHTELALDLGGTFEFYPSARTVARFDLGDLMIRHDRLAPPCSTCTTHNFISRLGIGLRF